MFAIRRCGKSTIVTVNNHPANGQSQTHSLGFGGNERFEYSVHFLWINARSCILYCDDNYIGAAMSGGQLQHTATSFNPVHCLDRVVGQVEDHLLQLTRM